MSEVAAIVNSPGRAGVSREMRDAGAVGMSRAQGFLTSSPREEHLRVGPHQGDGDFQGFLVATQGGLQRGGAGLGRSPLSRGISGSLGGNKYYHAGCRRGEEGGAHRGYQKHGTLLTHVYAYTHSTGGRQGRGVREHLYYAEEDPGGRDAQYHMQRFRADRAEKESQRHGTKCAKADRRATSASMPSVP
jgi:hypothetical protein